MLEKRDEGDLEVLIQTGLRDAVGIGLARMLLEEAGIPFFVMNESVAARQESGNVMGWWSIRVPRTREEETRAILESMKGR